MRSRRSRLETMRDDGPRGAALALHEIDEIGDYISTVQVGITMTSIGIGAVGEPVLAEALEPLFGKALGHGVAVVISVTIAYLIITSAHIVAGELVPKLYAIDRAEGVARRVAAPLRFFRRLFAPFIVVLTGISDRILRWIGVDPDRLAEEGSTPEELKALIAQSLGGGTLDPGEAGMLTGVFHLHEQEARQVMTPIPAVVTVDTSEDVETALRRCISSGHTRLRRDRGRQPGPRARDRPLEHARAPAHGRGAARVDRAARPRRADRARDQAARRPARRPPAPALVDGGRDRRVRPRRGDRDRRGHHRGGRRRDRRRDRPGGRRGPPAGERRLVRPRPRRGDRPARLRARAAGRHRRLQLGRRLRVRRARPAAQARRHDHRRRLLDPRRVRAREPHRGGADPRAPRGVPAARPPRDRIRVKSRQE